MQLPDHDALLDEYRRHCTNFDQWIRGFEGRYTPEQISIMRWMFTVGYKKGTEDEHAKRRTDPLPRLERSDDEQ